VLFRNSDNGKPKAETAAKHLKEINPDLSVAFFNGNVITEIGLGVFRRMDLVISCVDNIEARLFINESCWKVNKPWINGGIEAMQGVVDIFVPPNSSCYECTMTDLDYSEINRRHPCGLPPEQLLEGKIPTTPTIASIISGMMVQEAMKLVHGREVQAGSGLYFFGLTNKTMLVNYPVSPDCLAHQQINRDIKYIEEPVSILTADALQKKCSLLLGTEAIINLGFDLVVSASCLCGAHKMVLKHRESLKREDITCPGCGELMSTDITSSIDGKSNILSERTLAELGVPGLSVMNVTSENGGEAIFIELTGDESRIINFI